MPETLLLGSAGYIGSSIYHYINDVVGVDVVRSPTTDMYIDYDHIDKSFFEKYKNIILLAGHPNPASCIGDPMYSFDNNVVKFINLLKKINKNQKLIYASSSCVYDSKNNDVVNESCNSFNPISYYDVTKKVIDYYAELSDVEFYSLRFGSVNGLTISSNIMRDDIIINSMMKNAIQLKKIKSINPKTNRAILGIHDLYKVINKIIQNEDHRGIYNIASFNSTVGDIASFIGEKYESEVESIENEKQTLYDFKVSCDKFSSVYNFIFEENMETITDSILNNFDKVKFVRRDKCTKI